ncbi:hypothetical protein FEM48_Zijuj04G0168100 [Ziziphus jujuba var. spinosa]|uniref:Retrotransposon gag domain-containing protein n=1 Tax=Ziziphus jujuba var. spinosa TaxID=714518 RepID=A0A978VL11_ZIZJJ|nr:hypothetical protein FEM48_Zijuj04G0168100 [Ziziphus jujuba var. spinosa]
MEKIFSFMTWTNAQKVTCAVYMLKQSANHWWEMTSRAWNVERKSLSKAQKFEKGLRDGLRRSISVLRLQTYGEVLQRAQILEINVEMSMKAESKE